MKGSLERISIALVIIGGLGMALIQAIEVSLRFIFSTPDTLSALDLSFGILFIAVLFAAGQLFLEGKPEIRWLGLLLSVSIALGLTVYAQRLSAAAISVCFAGTLETYAAYRFTAWLPVSLDGVVRRQPLRSGLWGILGIVLLVQMLRLASYMADDRYDWWLTTRNPFWAKHMCLPAYFEAADLHRQGMTNVYDDAYYLAINKNASAHLTIKNMDAYAGDPMQYPPQFLLLPYAILSLTNDYFIIRTVWFCVQVFAFVSLALLLASWVRSTAGLAPMLLIPLVWVSVPVLQNFQFGQWHLGAFILAMGAMLAFEKKYHAFGGAMLAMAILSKIFPFILLVLLARRGRWKSIGWTLLWMTAITILAYVLLRGDPFHAFFSYQLPRLINGEAFDFIKDYPELKSALLADNLSLYAVVTKLNELGVPGMTPGVASFALKVYALVLLVTSIVVARKDGSNLQKVIVWLALLNLASFQSPAAWGDYVTAGSVWLLSFSVAKMEWTMGRILFLTACAIFSITLIGVVPMPALLPSSLAMVITILGTLLMIALNLWAILSREYESDVRHTLSSEKEYQASIA